MNPILIAGIIIAALVAITYVAQAAAYAVMIAMVGVCWIFVWAAALFGAARMSPKEIADLKRARAEQSSIDALIREGATRHQARTAKARPAAARTASASVVRRVLRGS